MASNPDQKALAEAKQLVALAVKDHDEGGYQFAGMYEILENRIARALSAARAEALEEAAKEAEAWWPMFDFESFAENDKRRFANPNQIAARIRSLASGPACAPEKPEHRCTESPLYSCDGQCPAHQSAEAAKLAEQYVGCRVFSCPVCAQGRDERKQLAEAAYLAGHAAAHSPPADKDAYLTVIREWKLRWMNDSEGNYRERAFFIDANMMHDLAQALAERTAPPSAAVARLVDAANEAYGCWFMGDTDLRDRMRDLRKALSDLEKQGGGRG